MAASTARAIRDDVAAGRVSAVEVCRDALARIEASNPALNSFLLVDADGALERARKVDARRAAGEAPGPLAGVPIAIKDNLCVRGMKTTAASKILATYVPPYDATVDRAARGRRRRHRRQDQLRRVRDGLVERELGLRPGAQPVGADRARRADRAAGRPPPWPRRRCPLALGSDTGGSIRQPASFCGVVGLKPTYGRVSRYGLLAFASSLDQIGPIARTVEDAALTLAVIAGPDRADATSSREPVPDLAAALTGDVKGLRVGVPRTFVSEGVDADVKAAFDAALAVLRRRRRPARGRGAAARAATACPAYYLVCTAEASSNLARYDGVKYGYRSPAAADGLQAMYTHSRSEGFGAEVKRRIMLGTYVLSAGYYDAFYLKAQQVRTLLRRDYDRAFERADVIAMPTSPIPPFGLGEKADDPLQMYLADIFTVSANLAGVPAISVPGRIRRAQRRSAARRLPARRRGRSTRRTLLRAGRCVPAS